MKHDVFHLMKSLIYFTDNMSYSFYHDYIYVRVKYESSISIIIVCLFYTKCLVLLLQNW